MSPSAGGGNALPGITALSIVHSGDFREGSVTGFIEADSRPKKHSRKITASILTPFSELLPNLYYSPIKKLENKQRMH
jgi:hypothetical protein